MIRLTQMDSEPETPVYLDEDRIIAIKDGVDMFGDNIDCTIVVVECGKEWWQFCVKESADEIAMMMSEQSAEAIKVFADQSGNINWNTGGKHK